MKINIALSAAAKKATSIITMASMLSSMLNLGLMLPAKAQLNPAYTEAAPWADQGGYLTLPPFEPLASLQSFISSPYPSGSQQEGINDEYTNISYIITTTNQLTIGGEGGFIKIATNMLQGATNPNGPPIEVRERWNEAWVAATMANNGALLADNVVVSPLPGGVTLTGVDLTDGNGDNNINTLELELTCYDLEGCVIPANEEITIDLKNDPLIKPSFAGPVMQNVFLGKYVVGNNQNLETQGEAKMTINSYYGGLTVQASVDARLTFAVSAYDVSQINPPNGIEYAQSTSNGCNFGTIMPSIGYLCIWQLDASTNAVGGLQVYVVQDQNMTYPGSGAEIEQFKDGTLVESAAPAPWSSPTGVSAGGANAHLGYTSDDADVFDADALGEQPFAGITTMTGAGAAATAGYGSLVADAYEPGDHQWLYGNILMSTVELEQAPASLGQSYGHTQYFIVVGNF